MTTGIRRGVIAAASGAAIVFGAIAIPLAATANPVAVVEAAPTSTPTPAPPSGPYAVHDHVPGDADSDPTWVWAAGGIFLLIVGGGLAASIVSARGSARRGG